MSSAYDISVALGILPPPTKPAPAAPRPILISIEGDIGAGKSTLIDQLKETHPQWHFIDEPVGTWLGLKTAEGTNLLELFYSDQDRYAYTFQNCALLSRAINIAKRIQEWKEACVTNPELATQNIFVTERCLETDFQVFAQMMYDTGKMNLVEWDLYKMWQKFVKDISVPLTAIVHVATPPTICAERIVQRGRPEEAQIPLSQLEELEKQQNRWLQNEEHNSVPVMKYKNFGDSPMDISHVEEFITKKFSVTD